MKILISATEASADLHGAHLTQELLKIYPELEVSALGGDNIKAQGGKILVHCHELSVMGLTEVIPKIPDVFRILRVLESWSKQEKPDCAVLIDSPDFNLRLAVRLKRLGIPVVYYICPQVWAWRSGRVKQMNKLCDKIYSILPFEPDFFAKNGGVAEFVGHPLLDEMNLNRISKSRAKQELNIVANPDKKWLAVLPGSRISEVKRILPSMIATIAILKKQLPDLEIIVPRASAIPKEMIEIPGAHIVDGQSETILKSCDVGLVASGTASLQAALCGLPSVITYRVSFVSSMIYRLVVPYRGPVAMPNIILGKNVFPEFLQHQATGEAMSEPLMKWLGNEAERLKVCHELQELPKKLGGPGASKNLAEKLRVFLEKAHATV